MKKNVKVFLFIIIFIPVLLSNKIVNAETNKYDDKIYKIGLIELEPYVMVNENGNLEGYYIEFFDLIGKRLNFKYEYVLGTNFEIVEMLESGEIDFALGMTITNSRAEKFLFSANPIALEKFALYTNEKIEAYNLNELNGLKFASIKGRATDWVLEFFKASNINIEIVYADTYEEANGLLDNGKVDLILDSAYKKSKYNKIYEFVSDQVYIAANKNNEELLHSIDNIIIQNEENGVFEKLYNGYFDKEKLKSKQIQIALNLVFKSTLGVAIIAMLFPVLRRYFYKEYIKLLIKKERYSVFYQPIYNVKSKEVLGFEALINDKVKDKNLLYSEKLISIFESKNVVSELCVWELEKIIFNYYELKKCSNLSEKDFYISLNIPINQFKNNKFVDKIINILNKSELPKNSICIEVMGNININYINKIISNIKRLKEVGFLIAIGDFGIEYSNLNVIQDLDIDIIKIDKIFTSNIDKSVIKNEIIRFILRIGKAQDKVIVLEGIDKVNQNKKIEEMNNDKLCVQGELYSKILSVEEIKKMSN